jgi:hypothetical protein
MAVFGPVSPTFLRRILELDGYALVIDDSGYWVLARQQETRSTMAAPIIVPRSRGIVPPETLSSVLRHAGISDEKYVWLFEIVSAARGADGGPPPVH